MAPKLQVIQKAMAATYAGDTSIPLIVYLAATSRLLPSPVSIGVFGESSAGKSHAIKTALLFIPTEECINIVAGSAKALIYLDVDFQHKTIYFSEMDSLPDDGPAASAIRSLVSERRMAYDVVVRDEASGKYVTHRIDKPGPTGLLVSGITPAQYQMGTRLLHLEIPESPEQSKAVMDFEASRAAGNILIPDYECFHDMQRKLRTVQSDKDFPDVIVPFAPVLSKQLAYSSARIKRDFSQLLTFIKTHALLFWDEREIDKKGRVIATQEDYNAVRGLLNPLYEVAASDGLTPGVRKVIQAVGCGQEVSVTVIAKRVKLSKPTVNYHLKKAYEQGYLVNLEARLGVPARVSRLEDPPLEPQGLPPAFAV